MGLIHRNGHIIIAPKFEEEHVGVFRCGVAMVGRNRKVGYINTKGDIVVLPNLNGAVNSPMALQQLKTTQVMKEW